MSTSLVRLAIDKRVRCRAEVVNHRGKGALRLLYPASQEAADTSMITVLTMGRRVWSMAVGHLGAGTHEVTAEVTLAPAVYFARLSQGQSQRHARIALIR